MNTLEGAFAFIRENKAKWWRLMVRYDGASNFTKLYTYEGNPDPEVDPTEDAIVQLQRKLSFSIHPTAQFQLFVKTAATAGKDTECGPFPFVLNSAGHGPQTNYNSNPYGINGLSGMPGFGAPATVQDFFMQMQGLGQLREQALTDKFTSMIGNVTKEMELTYKEQKLKEKEEELKAREKEVKETHSDYRNTVMEGVLKAGKVLFESWAPAGSGKQAASEIISGLEKKVIQGPANETTTTESNQPGSETEELTEEEKLLNSIAHNIAGNVNDLDGIKVIGVLVNEMVKDKELIERYKQRFKDARKNNKGNEQNSIPGSQSSNNTSDQ